MIDATHVNAAAQAEVVHQTLAELEADHVPIVPVLNKIDLFSEPDLLMQEIANFPDAVAISALTGEGIFYLLNQINQYLFENYQPIRVYLPYKYGGLISEFHNFGRPEEIAHTHEGVYIQGKIPGRMVARYKPFIRVENHNNQIISNNTE